MTVNIGSNSYTTSQTYDSAGRIDTQTYPASDSYPSGLQIENTYNGLGMLERVQSPGGGTVYYQMLDSDHYGKMTSRWLGDGTTTTQSYADHSARITEQHTQLGSTNIQRLTYAWDSVGNMSSRSDLINALTETFSYDGLDRLTQAQVGVATPKDYGYNIIGNMTSKTDVGNYAYLATQIHAVSQVSNGPNANSYNYNGNGNLQSGSDLPTLTWSSYNKPTQISKGTITYDFSYGTDKKRYKKVHNDGSTTSTTHYLGDSFEHKVTGSVNEYRHVIRAGGTTIAVITDKVGSGASTKYLHRDHLGSVTAITDTAGAIIERLSYGPWGQRRSATDWQTVLTTATDHRGYTGHEHLDDVGIIHMNGRVYSPKLGKMLSPDPVTGAPEYGQTYNRYSYVYNNPMKLTDPSGYDCLDSPDCPGYYSSGISGITSTNPTEEVITYGSRDDVMGPNMFSADEFFAFNSEGSFWGKMAEQTYGYDGSLSYTDTPEETETAVVEEKKLEEVVACVTRSVGACGQTDTSNNTVVQNLRSLQNAYLASGSIIAGVTFDDWLETSGPKSLRALRSTPLIGTGVEFGIQINAGTNDAGAIGRTYVSGLLAIPATLIHPALGVAVGVGGPQVLDVVTEPFFGTCVGGGRCSYQEFFDREGIDFRY